MKVPVFYLNLGQVIQEGMNASIDSAVLFPNRKRQSALKVIQKDELTAFLLPILEDTVMEDLLKWLDANLIIEHIKQMRLLQDFIVLQPGVLERKEEEEDTWILMQKIKLGEKP